MSEGSLHSSFSKSLIHILSMAAFTEALPYPVTAKHYLSQYEGIPMTAISRSCGRELETYDKLILEQLYRLSGGQPFSQAGRDRSRYP